MSRSLRWLLAVVSAAGIVVLLDYGAVARAAGLYDQAVSSDSYWLPGYAGLLYLRVPLVTLAALALFLAPGLCLTLRPGEDGGGRSLHLWLLEGFAVSLFVISAAVYGVDAAIGEPVRGRGLCLLLLAVSLVSWLAAVGMERHLRGKRSPSPIERPADVILLIVPLVVLLYALLPDILWQNFNGDGVEAFEAARLLVHRPLPFWGESFGEVVSWPGVTDIVFLYPGSWAVRLFGPLEASVRLPFLLYLLLTYSGLVAVITHGREEAAVGPTVRGLIWSSLFVYAVVVAFSATYNPYFADIGSPATQSTLQVALYLGVVVYFLRERFGWLVLFSGLTFFNLPSGLLLLALWITAVAVCLRPRPWRRIGWLTGALAGFVLLAGWLPGLFDWLGGPAPGDVHSLGASLERFRHLQYGDLTRLAYLVVPGGVLPALSLLLWSRQDGVARALTVVSVLYFALFYFKAYVALHFFIPAMLLPVAVFWRTVFDGAGALPQLPDVFPRRAVAVGCAVALVLSWPEDRRLHTQARTIGSHIEDRTSGYRPLDASTFHANRIYQHLFRLPGDPRVPEERYGVSPLVLRYYANRPDGDRATRNYILQPVSAPLPDGMERVGEGYGAALYVRDDSVWRAHRRATPPARTGADLYEIPMGIKLPHRPVRNGPNVIDVCAALRVRMGLDVCG